MNYWVIFPQMPRDCAILTGSPEVGPKGYQYDQGIPLLEKYPPRDQAQMVFDDDYEDRVKLYDFLPNLDRLVIVSSKVRATLAPFDSDQLEFLPIRILDHKKVVASDDYFIVNPVGSVEIIDMEKSDYAMSALDEGQIADIDDLVVNEEKLDEAGHIFRAKTMLHQIFISDEVKSALEDAGITNFNTFEAQGWDGLDI